MEGGANWPRSFELVAAGNNNNNIEYRIYLTHNVFREMRLQFD